MRRYNLAPMLTLIVDTFDACCKGVAAAICNLTLQNILSK